ncbi:suppressor of cytokine signaling 2-like isoform X2 [Cylas formicarius]|nr:suppressor of cytokine signaling 2-like isoform X2 [Cylas formicarius]
MLGCSTVCPKCKHEFACCPASTGGAQQCSGGSRRSLHVLSGGGLVAALAPPTSPGPSPQVSPSTPLSFVLPPLAPLQPLPVLEAKPETELQHLADTVRALRQSGWYYEGITFQESHEFLKYTQVGTFLIRNSSDPRFLFSLSVQTERGPTSVRLHYINGYFRLDAQTHLQAVMPVFPSVIDLIQHYVRQVRVVKDNMQVWVDAHGKWYSSIHLDRPLRKRDEPSSLKHLARLSIHKTIQSTGRPRIPKLPAPHTQLELPTSLITYLSEYPHSI